VPVARQYDVFRVDGDVLVVVVQSDLVEAMATRVVVPLLAAGAAGKRIYGLDPEIAFGDEILVLMPQLAATLTLAELGRPVGSVAHMRDAITRALSTLLSGV
jgi:toxin CcdB